MNTKTLTLSIIAVILSFIGGFLLANSLNRSEINTLRAESERLKQNTAAPAANPNESGLSDEEIRAKIAEADGNPNNYSYQRNLGLALYRYGAMKQDAALIGEATRLLQRAYDDNPRDYDVTVALGNGFYDIGYFKKDEQSFARGRDFYLKALEQKPNDADVRTDLGLSYYLTRPPDYAKAAAELARALEANPKHERALQFMTQTLLRQNKPAEAEKFHTRLRAVNPQVPDLDRIAQQLDEEQKVAR